MWNVAWTDPNKELVGEHRARKDKEGSEKNKSLSRHSVSTTSSKNSSQSALSRLRDKATRQSASSKASTRRDDSGALIFSTPEKPSKNHCRVEMSGGLIDKCTDHLMPTAPHLAPGRNARNPAVACTERSANGDSNDHEGVCSTLNTIALFDSDDVFSSDSQGMEQNEYPEARNPPKALYGKLADGTSRLAGLQSPTSQSFNSFNSRCPQSPTRSYAARYIMTNGDGLIKPVPPARSPLRPLHQKSFDLESIHNASLWREPKNWDTNALNPPLEKNLEITSGVESISVTALTEEVEVMARAQPEEALMGLKRQYYIGMSVEAYQELESQKQRWMLSVVQNLDQNQQHPTEDGSSQLQQSKSTKRQKDRILAFFEPKYSALYLAASWPDKNVYHLSNQTLSIKDESNNPIIRPIFTPSISTPCPRIDSSFDAVYSMVLPALCKHTEISKVLTAINKCLKPGGIFNLIIIDPIPNVDALGVKMRSWFVKYLLRNLETQGRSLNPTCILPDLLSQASLRGPGSILTKTRFYANPESIARHEIFADETATEDGQDKKTRAELRSIVGRMLWQEVWGQFVTAEMWWWQDAACMQECLELGTYWEYHSIQSVKAN